MINAVNAAPARPPQPTPSFATNQGIGSVAVATPPTNAATFNPPPVYSGYGNSAPKKSSVSPKVIAGMSLLLLLLVGGGTGIYLTQINQDVRQQAYVAGYPPPDPTGGSGGATPTPAVNPTTAAAGCTSIEVLDINGQPIVGSLDRNLKKGDAVKFRCSASSATVHHYEFKIAGAGSTKTLTATGNMSEPFTIPGPSDFKAQCRVCTSQTDCQPFEN